MPFTLVKKPNFKSIKARLAKAEDEWLKELALFMVDLHSGYVSNWNHQPEFTTEFLEEKGSKGIEVTTNDENWLRVNYGTGARGPKKKEYIIKPKDPKGVLWFTPKYKPKTTRRKSGGPGTRSGVPVFAREVRAKGIRPRRFDLRAKREAKKKFYPKWTKVLRRAITRR